MDFSVNEWKSEYQQILNRTPTIEALFKRAWLTAQESSFRNSTHQLWAHPLVCLIVNCGGTPALYGHDADFLEELFTKLKSDLTPSKVTDIKNRKTWHEFLPVFGELLFAYEMKKSGFDVKIEPGSRKERNPDLEWNDDETTIAIEINAVTENDGIRGDKKNYQDELSDAVMLSRLVQEYREATKQGKSLSPEVQRRIEEVKHYDSVWEDPAPRVFGGVPFIRSRFKSSGTTMTDLRGRKDDGEQVAKYKFRILGLILPTDYFPRPYSFLRLWETENQHDKGIRCVTSGTVFNSFYGKKGDPIYNYSHDIGSGKQRRLFAREHDREDGRFMKKSTYSTAVLCSVGTSQGSITTPISYKFIVYEPLGCMNWRNLLPEKTITRLQSALPIDHGLSKVLPRTVFGFLRRTVLYEVCSRRFLRPKVIR